MLPEAVLSHRVTESPRFVTESSTVAHYTATSHATSATAAGSACTHRIFLDAVAAPNTPATTTHTRKNTTTLRPSAPSISPQTSPAARNPLYSPWFIASTFDCSACSCVVPNARRPAGFVHRNISSTRKYACSNATSATRTTARDDTVLRRQGLARRTGLTKEDGGYRSIRHSTY